MLDHLPDLIDPYEFAEKRRRIKGKIPLTAMDHLRDAVLNPNGEASLEFEFRKDGVRAVISGRIEANLVLRCQCCLEPLEWPVVNEVCLGVVRSIDEADLLPETLEPLLVESDSAIALADIVQDELLLALPSVPQHSECLLPNTQPAAVVKLREHPFAALAQLKKTT